MRDHYDPLYLKSIRNNYAQVGAAQSLPLRDGGDAALREAATLLLIGTGRRDRDRSAMSRIACAPATWGNCH